MNILELDFHSTNSLITPSKFYPADINVPHHQLRNFISTAYEEKIFYVHNFDIFVIDLPKQQRSLVATVPFEARCLAANHGWVAVGGEIKGNCAFVRIDEGNSIFGQYGHDLIVDMLGKEIVNSMTIHRMRGTGPTQEDEIVVLISNNDKTVTLYSLSQQSVLCVLPHPVPMNYASMAPDCTMIAAVGDSNEAYFYRRHDGDLINANDKSAAVHQEHRWTTFAVPRIPSGEGVADDYSFAVAFSPSGEFCAVSAQGGAISVFDMKQLVQSESNDDAEKSILCTFKSSRADIFGCVRSLCFSPEPWDLLAWTEHHGYIGVADIRSFVRRQSVPLNRDAAEVIEIENVTSSEYHNMSVKERLKHQYMHRMRALRGHPPVGARSLDDLRGSQASPESLDLDSRERSVLDALETTIDDVEHHYSIRPYSINYGSSTNIRPSAASPEQRREFDVHLLNPGARVQDAHAPRRRHSVVLSEAIPGRLLSPETNRALMTASPAQMSEDNLTPPMSTNDLTPSNNPSSQPLPYNIPPSDPWHVIEAQLIADREAERRSGGATMMADPPASLAQIEAAIYAERQFQTRLEQQLTDERRLSLLLRTELEARERLLEARQQELESERARESRPSSSSEHVLQMQLQSEQQQGLQRSHEIENEIQSNRLRVERLMEEREALLLRAMDSQDRISLSATLGGLPPASTRPNNSAELDRVLRQIEEERRTRRQRITDLELQVRRAESRVENASTQSGSESTRDRSDRVSDARLLAGSARPGLTAASLRRAQQMDQYGVPFGSRTTPSLSNPHTRNLRAAVARRPDVAAGDNRSSLPRTSELAGRVSENDMRLARSMLHAARIDANGNWVTVQGIRRNPAQLLRATGVGDDAPGRAINIEDLLGDGGIGTAGIGWSPDGTSLYTGSLMGIFEFKVNLRDRMQFPSLGIR